MYNCRAHGLVLSTYSDEIRCRPLTLSRTDCRNGRGRGIVHDFVLHTCSQITAAWDCLPLSTRRPQPERLPPTSGNLTKQMSGIRHLKPCAVGPQATLWLFSIVQRAPVRASRQRKEPAVLCGRDFQSARSIAVLDCDLVRTCCYEPGQDSEPN
jgi:hypothetical protein